MKAAFKGTNSSVQPSWMELAGRPAGARGAAVRLGSRPLRVKWQTSTCMSWHGFFFSLSNVGFTGLKEILNEHLNSHAYAFIRDISSFSVLYN